MSSHYSPSDSIFIVDNGTSYTKAGFSGDSLPREVLPTAIGRPTIRAEEALLENVDLQQIYVGHDALEHRSGLNISYPIENGQIENWEDIEMIWAYLFKDRLKEDTHGRTILFTEPPREVPTQRSGITEMMFEKFGFERLQIISQAVSTLIGQGCTEGLVVDVGAGTTDIVTVVDGFVVSNLTRRVMVSGRDITRYLLKLLHWRGYPLNRSSDFQTVDDIKEKLCYVAMDTKKEMHLVEETTAVLEKYTLPDGRTITIEQERFMAPEALFRPDLIDVETAGITDVVWDTIQSAEIDMRKRLYANIVLTGGSSLFPGMPTRLETELRTRFLDQVSKGDTLHASRYPINVVGLPSRKYAVFEGASIVAETAKHDRTFWITKEMYSEEGAVRCAAKMTGFGLRKQ